MPEPIRAVLSDYKLTAPIKQLSAFGDTPMQFEAVKPISKAFAPMVRASAFDLSEMAIVTYLQARAYDKPVWLLPIVFLARFQHRCIVCNTEHGLLRPQDLKGRTVGVRAFSQTTGAWVRGILASEYGVDLDAINWITYEDAHVSEYADPAGVTRAEKGMKPGSMLQNGEIDAAILGNDLPDDKRLVPVIADPEADAKAWYARRKVTPINHMVVVTEDLLQRDFAAVRAFADLVRQSKQQGNGVSEGGIDMNPLGLDAMRHSLEEIIGYSLQQGLIPRRLAVEDLFHEKTRDLLT
jgi:4,5-dihydroxyphthalate decarboxylase